MFSPNNWVFYYYNQPLIDPNHFQTLFFGLHVSKGIIRRDCFGGSSFIFMGAFNKYNLSKNLS